MTPHAIADWFAAFEPVVYKHIGLGLAEHKAVYKEVVHVDTTDQQIQDTATWGGPGFLDRHKENEAITPKRIVQHWKKRHTAVFMAGALTCSKESLIGNRYKEIERTARSMGRAGQVTPDLIWGGFFDRAFTDIEIGDGLPLYDTAHPLPQGGTESNMISDALSHAGIETMLVNLSQLKGPDGVPQAYMAMKLMVHPTKWPLAWTLMKTPKRTGGLFNDLSFVYDNAIDIIPNRFLQSLTHWHVITDVTLKQENGLFWDWLEKLNFERDNVTNTRQAIFVAAFGAVFGARDWRGAYGSNSAT